MIILKDTIIIGFKCLGADPEYIYGGGGNNTMSVSYFSVAKNIHPIIYLCSSTVAETTVVMPTRLESAPAGVTVIVRRVYYKEEYARAEHTIYLYKVDTIYS